MTSIFTEGFLTGQLAKRLNDGLTWQMSKAFAEMGLRINSLNQVESIVPGVAVDPTNPVIAALNNYRGAIGEVATKDGEIAELERDVVAHLGTIGEHEVTIDGLLLDKARMTGYIAAIEDGLALVTAQVVGVPLEPAYTKPEGGWEAFVLGGMGGGFD